MACVCCWSGALCAAVPLAQKLYASPAGKAGLIGLAPFFALFMALATGMTEMAAVVEKVSCISECDCARSYAIGGVLVWLLAIQGVWRGSGDSSASKPFQSTAPPATLDAKGRVAAKAA